MTLFRLTRGTRFLPRFPVNPVHRFYRSFLKNKLHRITNFDADLTLDLDLTDAIGVTLWHIPQRFEPKERELFCSSIHPGSVVLDVGANIGIYSLLAAKRKASVFAIEADPENASMLRHHLALNKLQATVLEMAALDAPGKAGIRRNPTNSGGSTVISEAGDIEARPIDSLDLPPVDVCKMDIEGKELLALHGMTETLRRSPQMKLLIEYNVLSDQPALLSFLRQYFRHIAVAGHRELKTDQLPPTDCNLWCWN